MNSDNDEGGGEYELIVPNRPEIRHYHGNETRVLFVLSAVILIVAQSVGANLPLSTTGAVLSAVVLVIAAGITNPAQGWIHWMNAFIAMYGTFLFGVTAVDHYRAGMDVFDPSFTYVEALALLALLALYFTVRTIRGFHLRKNLS
ncbi:MAG TPA: hypothetical protein VNF51_01960 [Candidatus Paceibacterota bacterium]|nr:hypothetical protein [Candidatus Paceibacterota bacterium]